MYIFLWARVWNYTNVKDPQEPVVETCYLLTLKFLVPDFLDLWGPSMRTMHPTNRSWEGGSLQACGVCTISQLPATVQGKGRLPTKVFVRWQL